MDKPRGGAHLAENAKQLRGDSCPPRSVWMFDKRLIL